MTYIQYGKEHRGVCNLGDWGTFSLILSRYMLGNEGKEGFTNSWKAWEQRIFFIYVTKYLQTKYKGDLSSSRIQRIKYGHYTQHEKVSERDGN